MSEVNCNLGEVVGGEPELGNIKGGMQNGHNGGKVGGPPVDGEIDDPEILAAIAASQKDADDEIKAAIEASKKEDEVDKDDVSSRNISDEVNDNSEEKISENGSEESSDKAPVVLINTMYKTNQTQHEDSEENTGDKEEPKNEEVDANDQIALEGEPEIGENPFDMSVEDTGNPLAEGSDDDPLNGNTEGDENDGDDGFLDKINAGNLDTDMPKKPPKKKRANPVYITPVNKRKRSFSGSSEEEEEDEYIPGSKRSKKSKKKPAVKSRPKRNMAAAEVVFKCSVCSFAGETVGELSIHKYSSHKNQAKPSYLDLGEAAVVTLDNKQGSSKSEVLKHILSEHKKIISDEKKNASKMLAVALAAGVELGRLRQGLLGRKNAECFWVVNKGERKKILDRWRKNKRSVEHMDEGAAAVGNIEEDSEEFMAIKEKLTKYNIQVTTAPKDTVDSKRYGRGKRASKPVSQGAAVSMKDSSDDEICVLEEKITPKTKQKILQRKKMLAKGIVNKTVIRVNSNQGKQMLKKISSTGVVPKAATTTSRFSAEDEEDIQLTCPVCLSCFWYPNQTHEHMKSVHNIENPEKFIIERKKA